MEHVEVLERLRGVLEHGKMGDKCLIAPDLVTAAIAALSAPQPPAEAQPVAWEWEYIGVDQYPRGHKVARSLREMDPTNPPYPETWRPTRPLIYGDTAPPSAPVGVEAVLRDALQGLIDFIEIDNLPMDADAMFIAKRALSQQPAAADGVKCPWDGGSPCVEPMPAGMVYPKKPAPRAGGYLDTSGVEWNAWDAGQMEAYARAAYSDGWEAGYRAALRDHDQEVGNG